MQMPLPPYLQELSDMGIKVHQFHKPSYKYTSISSAENIIKNISIRFRTPTSFNDPLEFSKELLNFKCSMKTYKEKLISGYEQKFRRKLTKPEVKQLLMKFTIDEYKRAYELVLENGRNSSLLFCSSMEFDNSLMWSHYSQSHTGVVIGFFIPPVAQINNNNSMMTLCVNYTDIIEQKPAFTAIDDEQSKSLFYWIYTKSKVWEYEKEVRTFIDNTDNSIKLIEDNVTPYSIGKYADVGFEEKHFAEIYYGISTPITERNKLEALIDEMGLQMNSYQMEIVKGTFNLKERLIKQRRNIIQKKY